MSWRGILRSALLGAVAGLVASALLLAGMAGTAHGAFPGSNGRIAFSESIGDDTGEWHLQTVRPNGGSLRLISRQGVDPAFSPRGWRLVYGAMYDAGLWVRRANGRGPARRLTRSFDYAPDWSSDGRRIVFTREVDVPQPPGQSVPPQLQVRIYAGGASRRLADGADPAWSVGGEIAFRGADGIYGIRPDGSGLRLIVKGGAQPDWSPDGRRLAFVRGGRITIAAANGRVLRRLPRGSEPAFSADGRRLAYITAAGNLATMSVRGSRRRIDARPFDSDLSGPDWQPVPRRAGH